MVERYHVPMSHGMMVAQIVSAFCGYFSARRITRQRLAMSVNVFGDTLDSYRIDGMNGRVTGIIVVPVISIYISLGHHFGSRY